MIELLFCMKVPWLVLYVFWKFKLKAIARKPLCLHADDNNDIDEDDRPKT